MKTIGKFLAICVLTVVVAACSKDSENTSYPSAPLTLATEFGFSKNLLDVADVAIVVVDENGRVHKTPLTKENCQNSTASTPDGFMNAGALIYGSAIRKVTALVPAANTYVGFMLSITPKTNAMTAGETIELIAASHFKMTDKFNSEFINTTNSYVQSSVDASFLANACEVLSNNCTFTYLEQPNGAYAYAPVYNFSESIEFVNKGDLTYEESITITENLLKYCGRFGTRRWSTHIANAIFNSSKTEVEKDVAEIVKSVGSDNVKPLEFKYSYPNGSGEEYETVFTINP